MVKKGQKKAILSSTLITVFIVIMLIISGPAQAVSVKILGLDPSYTSGSSISFRIKIEIEDPDKYVPITNISLDLTGPGVNKKSTFYLNGTPIPGGDSIISISPDDDNPSGQYSYGYGYGFDNRLEQGTNFGYGYGYGYGYGVIPDLEYSYDITIDTTSLPEGSYSMVASLNTGRTEKPAFLSETKTFDIVTSGEGGTPDIPGSISGLHNISYAPDYINWTWNDPADTDFSKVIVSIDGGSTSDVLNGTRFYNATGFAPDTEHTISTRTVDTSGNTNATWVNHTARTAPTPTAAPIRVTIEISPKTINPNSSGVITVSVLNNTPAGFDVADINISTVRFGPGNAPVNTNNTAANKLILKFNTTDTNILCGDTQATLAGKTYSGHDIVGSDSFRTKECSVDVLLSTDEESGRTTTTVTHESPSGDMTVTIPAGTRALDREGHPLSSITITSLVDLPSKARKKLSSKDRPIGEFVELGPSGATFAPPIQIRYNYTEPLSDGVSESSLQIRTYNETTDSWETLLIVERNTESNYIIANVSHFSTFALIGTVPEAPSSGPAGTGGSSGGGGVITLEPYDNIAKAESQERDLIAGKPVLYTFTTPELGIYELAVTGKENENDIAIRAEVLKGTSKLVTSPAPGAVYKNVNIWAGTKRIEKAIIRFKVENSWLDGNSFATGEVKMVKWDGNKWILLDTTESGKDASYTYFEVKTDAFSVFAITGLKGGVLPTATPTMTQQPEETSTGTGTATITQTPTSEAPPVNLATIMFVIVLIAIVAVVYLKRKVIFK